MGRETGRITMTEVERYDHRNTLQSTGHMENAWRLAQRIASTEFVPKGLRGSPEKVLAALLLGHEKGIGAMTALQYIDVIEGRATAQSALKQAQAEAAGARLKVVVFTAERCVVHAWAPGDTGDPTVVEWTIDDAKAAKLTSKDNWQKHPRKMLFRRAMSDACDLVAAAAIVGIPPSADEVDDDRYVADAAAAPQVSTYRPVTVAEITPTDDEPGVSEWITDDELVAQQAPTLAHTGGRLWAPAPADDADEPTAEQRAAEAARIADLEAAQAKAPKK
jgi:hypothetical protein